MDDDSGLARLCNAKDYGEHTRDQEMFRKTQGAVGLFSAVPNASQKDQEKLLLQKHQEKLRSIILLLLPQARETLGKETALSHRKREHKNNDNNNNNKKKHKWKFKHNNDRIKPRKIPKELI
ncbi:hypothetical protein Anapl_14720 [Anas platyrhynchos]|uniref:Uncharacterized protein n=1 Tax=Anas platyrhynchos TaxID=8839 RepID=R0JLG8_ANAPL|nr:hypothetical protein Anapl_14720 [Anas platyrhynchos]